MQLDVPYAKQSTLYSCGPTSLKMLLAYFGIHAGEDELIHCLQTDEQNGTDHAPIVAELEGRGLHCTHTANASFDDILNALEARLPVLVNYINPHNKYGHFAVVIGATHDHIVLNDPKNGEGFSLKRDEFEELWVDGQGENPRWMLVAALHEAQLPALSTVLV